MKHLSWSRHRNEGDHLCFQEICGPVICFLSSSPYFSGHLQLWHFPWAAFPRAAFPVDCWTPCHGCSDDIFNFLLHLKLAHYHFFPPKSFSFPCLLGQYLGEGVLKAGIGVGQFTLGLWCFLGPVLRPQPSWSDFVSIHFMDSVVLQACNWV